MQKLLIFITVLLTTTTVQADFLKPTWCDKAASYPEKAVCDDDGLSASAIALENRWKAYRSNHSESEISLAKIVLNDWNKDPFQKCENKDCIRAAYTKIQEDTWYKEADTVMPSWDNSSTKTATPGKKVQENTNAEQPKPDLSPISASTNSIPPASDVYQTTAADLLKGYRENSLAIEERIGSKSLEINGRISNIAKNRDNVMQIKLSTEPVDLFLSVTLAMRDSEKDKVLNVKTGETITVICKSVERSFGGPDANDCVFK